MDTFIGTTIGALEWPSIAIPAFTKLPVNTWIGDRL